jgi:HlyD family secretion protein
MNKSLKKTLLIAGIAVAVCAAVWGGLTLARNAQRGDVNVYRVSDFAMTDYWGDTANTSGSVSTDKLQKLYISETQSVSEIYVKEGQTVKKGDKLMAYDTSLSQATVEQAEISLERAQISANASKRKLELYRFAENKEKLQLEYDTQYMKLEALIKAQDEAAGRYEPVKEGLLSVEGSNGRTKETPLYYQMLEDSGKQEYYLTDETIRTKILKNRSSAYVVLVEKAGNVTNGSVTCYGVYVVADDTAAPVKLKMLNDLPPYEDVYSTKSTEEIKEARKELDKIQALLEDSFTKEELKSLIATTEKEVYNDQRAVRQAQIELEKKKKELGDGTVYSEIDGVVKAVRDAKEAFNNNEPVVEVSGGGGYYVTGSIGELDLGTVKIGDKVQISSWMTGTSCEGEIVEISDFPTNNGSYWGSDSNSNVSYYPFKVFVSEDAALQAGDYVDMSYQKTVATDGPSLYLQTMFIRTENGKSYVLARGEDGKLEQRWVQTGRDLWGSYTQIRGGLTVDDLVAFPYGRDVKPGAATVEATADQLYGGM